jgi:hypothetical protein
MTGRVPTRAGILVSAALVTALASTPGCAFAVEHPAVAAGVVGGTLAFGTCKLASDNYGACALVGGGAGAFLGLIAAAALWLGGDGHSVAVEEQAQPLPEDSRPRKPRRRSPDRPPAASPADPDAPTPASPTPATPAPPSPAPASPTPPSPAPASPPPASPPGS